MIHSFVRILFPRAFLTTLKYKRIGSGRLVRRRTSIFFSGDDQLAPPADLPTAIFVESSSSKRNSLSLIRIWLNAAPSSENSLMRSG
jgi:hypothetical protein